MRISALYVYLCMLLIVLAGIASFLFLRSQHTALSSLDSCFPSASAVNNSGPDDECLKSRVDSLLQSHSAKELMGYVIASTSPYMVTSYCHDAAHIIGEETFIRSSSV